MNDFDWRFEKTFASNRHLVDHMRRKVEKLRERGKLGRAAGGHWVALRTGADKTT